MSEAIFWTLLSPLHWLIIVAFLLVFAIEAILLWKYSAKGMSFKLALVIVAVLGTSLEALSVREAYFPGGGLYDKAYVMDVITASQLQKEIEEYKTLHNRYPTTNQGFDALCNGPRGNECPRAGHKYAPHLKYESDGTTYKIESQRTYAIHGLAVFATNDTRAGRFIRDQ